MVQTTQSTYNVGEVMERAEDGILHVTVGPQTASVYIACEKCRRKLNSMKNPVGTMLFVPAGFSFRGGEIIDKDYSFVQIGVFFGKYLIFAFCI